MAYKRRTKKTGPNSRSSTTHSTKGPSTYSTSNKAGNTTYTYTSKGGKYFMTRTTKLGDGYVERKRVMSSAAVTPKRSSRRKSSDSGLGFGGILFFGLLILLGLAFGG